MLQILLKGWGDSTEGAEDGSDAIDRVKETPYNVILMAIKMARFGGIEALTHIKDHNPAIPVLLMKAYSSIDTAVGAMKLGAYYVLLPYQHCLHAFKFILRNFTLGILGFDNVQRVIPVSLAALTRRNSLKELNGNINCCHQEKDRPNEPEHASTHEPTWATAINES